MLSKKTKIDKTENKKPQIFKDEPGNSKENQKKLQAEFEELVKNKEIDPWAITDQISIPVSKDMDRDKDGPISKNDQLDYSGQENPRNVKINKFKNKREIFNRIDLLQNRDYGFLYPSLDDPNFNIKIAEKKEFFDTKVDIKVKNVEEEANIVCGLELELAPHQQFVKNFLSFQTPYNSLLLYHGLGTGKTCAAITIAEEQRDYLLQLNISQRIIVVASPNVQENFKLQLFDERKLELVDDLWNIKNCTGNKFLREINPVGMKGLSRERVIRQIHNIINNYYLFLGYIGFANYINKMSSGSENNAIIKKRLNKVFKSRLIIIDEVHNIRIAEDNKKKRVAQELFKLVSLVDNLRLLFLSATPMYNSYKEIIWLLNLMNLNDDRSQIMIRDVFDMNGNFKVVDGEEIGKDLLQRKATGYISYVHGENPYSFPYKIWPRQFSPKNTFKNGDGDGIGAYPSIQLNDRKIIQPLEHISVYTTKIGEYQGKAYEYIIDQLKNSTLVKEKLPNFENMETFGYVLLQKPLEALNMIYPGPGNKLEELIREKNYNFDSKEFVGKAGLTRLMKYEESYTPPSRSKFEYKPSEYGRIFAKENIGKYSSKIKNICDNIIDSTGVILIYSQYIDGGVVPIALALEEMGFTRHGNVNSLFNKPPVDILNIKNYLPRKKREKKEEAEEAEEAEEVDFIPAKYVMITGDKLLSPDNNADIKAATNPENKYGHQVKVVLISKAGSEGIDLKFIRQVHILEPWYNMNRTEQIIGRAVRTCSHKDLPFSERNVEIFLHATLLGNAVEAADLYVYRLAELKALQIGRVTRLLKEISVDCILNISQNNFDENIMNQVVKQKLSNGKTIDYKVGDKPYSAVCDYMDTCSYTCRPMKLIEENEVNPLTYNEAFITTNNEKIIERIKKVMAESYFYTKTALIAQINLYKNYPELQIDSALTQLINDRSEFLVDKYKRLGHLINIHDLYLFQPIELTDKQTTIFDRSVPLDYKRDFLFLEPKIVEDKSRISLKLQSTGLAKEIIKEITRDYNTATREQLVARGESDYYKFMSLVLQELLKIINRETLYYFVVEHILELLDFDNTITLMNYLYETEQKDEKALTDFERILKLYYDTNLLVNKRKKITGFLLNNKNKRELMILKKEKEWVHAESEDYVDLEEKLKELIVSTKKLNEIFGFITDFKKIYNIFKVKILKAGHKGARCDKSGKAEAIKMLNDILEEERFDTQNTKKMSHTQICIYQEMYLRYFNNEGKNEKIWFLSPGIAILNNIENLKIEKK